MSYLFTSLLFSSDAQRADNTSKILPGNQVQKARLLLVAPEAKRNELLDDDDRDFLREFADGKNKQAEEKEPKKRKVCTYYGAFSNVNFLGETASIAFHSIDEQNQLDQEKGS
jgi:hypothetical protein